MSTNFFWHHAICEHCDRFERLHICSSMVTFEGHFTEEWSADNKLVWTPLIVSWLDWTEKLLSEGEVWNEYGDRIDTHEFINMVESTDLAPRRRAYDWNVAHRHDIGGRPIGVGRDQVWLDDFGFSFYGSEFA